MRIVNASRRRMIAALMPQDCLLCGGPADRDGLRHDIEARSPQLCRDCRAGLPYLPGNGCPVCALPSALPSAPPVVCGRCLAEPPNFDESIAALAYAYPVEPLIRRCKYHGAVALSALFGDLLSAAIVGAARPDLMTAVPLAKARLAERGFNQALEIARPLARRSGLPLRADLVFRVRDTHAQADLPFAERRNNVRGAFACVENLDRMHIAVIDDVMTTGATLDEFARTLKARGAARVVNWVVARTPRG